MGCLCSKERSKGTGDENKKHNDSSVQLHAVVPQRAGEHVANGGGGCVNDGSHSSKETSQANAGSITVPSHGEEKKDNFVARRQKGQYQRYATMDVAETGKDKMVRIVTLPRGYEGEQAAAGWPSWLASVAPEAVNGWVPRRAESFEKLEKIGQGTYSTVYRARDLETNKIVAMKKVRFTNMDPESVRFMAREIHILRKLDHINVMKLESIVISRMSETLFLVFEYMEHDLAGLAAARGIKFTEPQIKCYMKQFFRGLEHCHSRGVLHRDIKGSNLLIDKNGILKIADFGLATLYHPRQRKPLTSRVVTLWYRPPELLLGSTRYDATIDMWSAGCILAELFAGKPIMPGRTEVEQMHKIFKLCGSPSEDYWQKTRLPQATSFKPQHRYKRKVTEAFKNFPPEALALVDKLLSIKPKDRGTAASALRNEFFTMGPLPCDPSTLPQYPPSKELTAKLHEEQERQKAGSTKLHGHESLRAGTRYTKCVKTQEKGLPNSKDYSHKYNPHEDGSTGFRNEPRRGAKHDALTYSTSVIHPALGSLWTQREGTKTNNKKTKAQESLHQVGLDFSGATDKRGERDSTKQIAMSYVRNRNIIHYSGPLVPAGENIEDMLKEHEKQIQQAVRRAQQGKAKI